MVFIVVQMDVWQDWNIAISYLIIDVLKEVKGLDHLRLVFVATVFVFVIVHCLQLEIDKLNTFVVDEKVYYFEEENLSKVILEI